MNKDLSSSIKKIGWAYLLLFFEFNIGINGKMIDILPNWVGYLIIYHTFKTLSNFEESVLLLNPLHKFLFLYDLVIWIFKMVGIIFDIYSVSVIFTIISVYFNFQLITNIVTIAQMHDYPKSHTLLTLRSLSVIVLTLVGLPTPWTASSPLIWEIPSQVNLMSLVVLLAILIWVGVQLGLIHRLFHFASYEAKREAKVIIEQL